MLLAYEVLIKGFVISFDLASSSGVVGSSVYEFDSLFFCLGLEFLGNELLSVVQVNLLGRSAFSQRPSKRINCLFLALFKVCFRDYPIP